MMSAFSELGGAEVQEAFFDRVVDAAQGSSGAAASDSAISNGLTWLQALIAWSMCSHSAVRAYAGGADKPNQVLWTLAGGGQVQATAWEKADRYAVDKLVRRRLENLLNEQLRRVRALRNASRVRASSGQSSDPEKQAAAISKATAALEQLGAERPWSVAAPPATFLSPVAFKAALEAASTTAGTPQPAAAAAATAATCTPQPDPDAPSARFTALTPLPMQPISPSVANVSPAPTVISTGQSASGFKVPPSKAPPSSLALKKQECAGLQAEVDELRAERVAILERESKLQLAYDAQERRHERRARMLAAATERWRTEKQRAAVTIEAAVKMEKRRAAARLRKAVEKARDEERANFQAGP